jgi:hypothetical protein
LIIERIPKSYGSKPPPNIPSFGELALIIVVDTIANPNLFEL